MINWRSPVDFLAPCSPVAPADKVFYYTNFREQISFPHALLWLLRSKSFMTQTFENNLLMDGLQLIPLDTYCSSEDGQKSPLGKEQQTEARRGGRISRGGRG